MAIPSYHRSTFSFPIQLVLALPFDIEKRRPSISPEMTPPVVFIPRSYVQDSPTESTDLLYVSSVQSQPKYIPMDDTTQIPLHSIPPPPPPPSLPLLDLNNLTQLLNQIRSVDLPRSSPSLTTSSVAFHTDYISAPPQPSYSSHPLPPSQPPLPFVAPPFYQQPPIGTSSPNYPSIPPPNHVPPPPDYARRNSADIVSLPPSSSQSMPMPNRSRSTDYASIDDPQKKLPKGRKPPPKVPYLPCKHFASTGKCPFGERCTFLHGNPPDR